jgi:hypothetical protein
MLACFDNDVNLLGDNIDTIKNNIGIVTETCKEAGPEVNT